MGTCVRADLATRGFAISLVTSASVSLSSSFLVFFLSMIHDVTSANRLQFTLDHVRRILGFLGICQIHRLVGNCLDGTSNGCAHLRHGDATPAAGPRFTSSAEPSTEVKEAFNKHECEKYPRKTESLQMHEISLAAIWYFYSLCCIEPY